MEEMMMRKCGEVKNIIMEKSWRGITRNPKNILEKSQIGLFVTNLSIIWE